MMYIVDLSYAYFGIGVENGLCTEAPPIAKWMLGKSIEQITSWVEKKKGMVFKYRY